MKIVCIDVNASYRLTVGKIYNVVKEDEKYYHIIDNCGDQGGWKKERFSIVVSDGVKKKATYTDLDNFSREELRNYAKSIGVKRGRNKEDTIYNLRAHGVTVTILLN